MAVEAVESNFEGEDSLVVDAAALGRDHDYRCTIMEQANLLTVRGIPWRLRLLEKNMVAEESLIKEQREAAEDTRHWGITELDINP